jgi:hypothetical protein
MTDEWCSFHARNWVVGNFGRGHRGRLRVEDVRAWRDALILETARLRHGREFVSVADLDAAGSLAIYDIESSIYFADFYAARSVDGFRWDRHLFEDDKVTRPALFAQFYQEDSEDFGRCLRSSVCDLAAEFHVAGWDETPEMTAFLGLEDRYPDPVERVLRMLLDPATKDLIYDADQIRIATMEEAKVAA